MAFPIDFTFKQSFFINDFNLLIKLTNGKERNRIKSNSLIVMNQRAGKKIRIKSFYEKLIFFLPTFRE